MKRLITLAAPLLVVGLALAGCTDSEKKPVPEKEPAKADAPRVEKKSPAQQAFLDAYAVFMHPRCMNCHPSGDAPLQGDDSRVHAQGVKRGKDGKGKFGMKCSACHQAANVPGENMPPGNPNWHLPSEDMPLVFQGLTPAQLATNLKDSKKNGGKTLAEVLHHIEKDGLVLGCWTPGDGRKAPPVSHAEFAKKFKEWVDAGAPSPE